jgi:hypothetical protein
VRLGWLGQQGKAGKVRCGLYEAQAWRGRTGWVRAVPFWLGEAGWGRDTVRARLVVSGVGLAGGDGWVVVGMLMLVMPWDARIAGLGWHGPLRTGLACALWA